MLRFGNDFGRLLAGALVGLLMGTSGCSLVLDGKNDGTKTGSTMTIRGFAEKGPFEAGAAVHAMVLDEDLNLLGSVVAGETGARGAYSVAVPKLSGAKAVQLMVSGKYFDERTGVVSTQSATLQTILPLTDPGNDSSGLAQAGSDEIADGNANADALVANINILTDLAADRIKVLVLGQAGEAPATPVAAEARARGEVLEALGFSASSVAQVGPLHEVSLTGDAAGADILAVASALVLEASAARGNEAVDTTAFRLRAALSAGAFYERGLVDELSLAAEAVRAAHARIAAHLNDYYGANGDVEVTVPDLTDAAAGLTPTLAVDADSELGGATDPTDGAGGGDGTNTGDGTGSGDTGASGGDTTVPPATPSEEQPELPWVRPDEVFWHDATGKLVAVTPEVRAAKVIIDGEGRPWELNVDAQDGESVARAQRVATGIIHDGEMHITTGVAELLTGAPIEVDGKVYFIPTGTDLAALEVQRSTPPTALVPLEGFEIPQFNSGITLPLTASWGDFNAGRAAPMGMYWKDADGKIVAWSPDGYAHFMLTQGYLFSVAPGADTQERLFEPTRYATWYPSEDCTGDIYVSRSGGSFQGWDARGATSGGTKRRHTAAVVYAGAAKLKVVGFPSDAVFETSTDIAQVGSAYVKQLDGSYACEIINRSKVAKLSDLPELEQPTVALPLTPFVPSVNGFAPALGDRVIKSQSGDLVAVAAPDADGRAFVQDEAGIVWPLRFGHPLIREPDFPRQNVLFWDEHCTAPSHASALPGVAFATPHGYQVRPSEAPFTTLAEVLSAGPVALQRTDYWAGLACNVQDRVLPAPGSSDYWEHGADTVTRDGVVLVALADTAPVAMPAVLEAGALVVTTVTDSAAAQAPQGVGLWRTADGEVVARHSISRGFYRFERGSVGYFGDGQGWSLMADTGAFETNGQTVVQYGTADCSGAGYVRYPEALGVSVIALRPSHGSSAESLGMIAQSRTPAVETLAQSYQRNWWGVCELASAAPVQVTPVASLTSVTLVPESLGALDIDFAGLCTGCD